MKIEAQGNWIRLWVGQVEVMRHSAQRPALEIGKADFHYRMTQAGMPHISSPVTGWVKLRGCQVGEDRLVFYDGEVKAEMVIEDEDAGFSCELILPPGYNYARLSLAAERNEAVYGGGVQFSHLNLRGKRFPMWAGEMGLGRHPLRLYTWLADLIAGAGGKHWSTYFPQPAFISTRGYGCLVDTDGYSVLDFSQADRHSIEILGGGQIHFFAGKDLKETLSRQADRLGIMPAPPSWVFEGGILGIQGGLPYVRETVDKVLSAGARLTGIWTQDWAGVRVFWQGKRLFWNWTADKELYPNLKDEIRRRSEQGIRWLTYLNPYFNPEGEYFRIAKERGYLVKNGTGEVLICPIAGFQVGIVDFTNPEAWRWFKEVIIQQNTLALGVRGWMADYAEDVPEGARFYDGRSGKDLHNLYPRLWAQLNREAVVEAGLQDETLIFHRSGYNRATRSMNMYWGGDQVVSWNPLDGLPAGVTGGLSGCMSGVQYSHTDAGGYFSFRWIKRSKEMLFRWCEANAFSPVLRTHEGNRPWAGVQPWQDEETLGHFALMTRMHAALAPYLKHVSEEAQLSGVGMMRPFCLENPGPRWQNKQDAWYLGPDMLVYPVMKPGLRRLRVDIPEGEWIHVFSGVRYSSGFYNVECPIGKPAIFYRRGSALEGVFKEVGEQ